MQCNMLYILDWM